MGSLDVLQTSISAGTSPAHCPPTPPSSLVVHLPIAAQYRHPRFHRCWSLSMSCSLSLDLEKPRPRTHYYPYSPSLSLSRLHGTIVLFHRKSCIITPLSPPTVHDAERKNPVGAAVGSRTCKICKPGCARLAWICRSERYHAKPEWWGDRRLRRRRKTQDARRKMLCREDVS